jgi:glycosyltransferase involved in cell wall biosynthesis
MPRFLTVFPECEDMHLCKDVGMIPYLLHKKFGYNSSILTYDNGPYPRALAELKGLNIITMKRSNLPMKHNRLLDIIKFLSIHAKQIDILQLYHSSNDSIVAALFYKRLNPKGVVYMKLDGGQILHDPRLARLVQFDLCTIESKYAYDKVKINYPNVELVPNGADFSLLPEAIPYDDKDNLIVHSGRLGDELKASKLVVDTFVKISKDYPDWKLLLLGPMTESFKDYCFEVAIENELGGRIIMPGYISNMNLLYYYYNKSKIIFMPSISESWCIALVEAMALGCVPLVSDIPVFRELTGNCNTGFICMVNDEMGFEMRLRSSLMYKALMRKESTKAKQAVADYDWNKIVTRLHNLLTDRLASAGGNI